MSFLFNPKRGIARGLLPYFQGAVAIAGKELARVVPAADAATVRRQRGRGVVVIMGATGTGKSKLSIDLAGRFPVEVLNADKIQVYRGLDITTNKMPIPDRRGVPHHLLGEIDPAAGELSSAGFRELAATAAADIALRGRIPVVAGGSNSYIHAMMAEKYDAKEDPFTEAPATKRHRLRYRSCLLWVDVGAPALPEYLDRRVDEMLGMGMVEELEKYFASYEAERHPGLAKAIGVLEFREYFRRRTAAGYKEAVAAIKANTRRLAEEQVRKIERLGEMGWPLQRLDATATVEAKLASVGKAAEASASWEKDVLGPALSAVERFLEEDTTHQLQLLETA